ncbi:MAG: hypothetical protein ACRDFW_11225 [bacterium]
MAVDETRQLRLRLEARQPATVDRAQLAPLREIARTMPALT